MILLKHGHVVDPSQELDRVADILIAEGRIQAVGENLDAAGAQVVDVTGMVVMPGLIDILFLKYWYPIQTKMMNKYRHLKARRQYKYFKCKECGQQLRVPRKKGKIEITCPKCRHTFIKKT